MTKIEPMSIEEIKAEVATLDWRFVLEPRANPHKRARQWLTWIHAEARARYDYHGWNAALKVDHSDKLYCSTCDMRYEHWIAAVKKEVGWMED